MPENVTLWLPTADQTAQAGASLSNTLYNRQLTIGLSGDLGAGKTTFLQGFLRALGVADHVASPTFALEQRYHINHGELLHLDLYRLSPAQAAELIAQSHDFPGIRCIEWADRLPDRTHLDQPLLFIEIQEESVERRCDILFDDISLPSAEDIDRWRREVLLPSHIAAHCDAVASLCQSLAESLIKSGNIVRPLALKKSAEVHDLFRFVDFRANAGPSDFQHTQKEKDTWQPWKERYPGLRHEAVCTAFLREKGYPELAGIVAAHGLRLPPSDQATIEQKLLYYADKRVIVDRIVSLDERFADFAERYGDGPDAYMGKVWLEEARRVERELGMMN